MRSGPGYGIMFQPHQVAQTKQSGWRKIIDICDGQMDILVFFRHFRCKFSTVSKFSDYVSCSKDGNPRLFGIFRLCFFSKDVNPRLFGIFRLCFLFKGWKSPTFAMDIFGFFRHFRWRCLEKTKQHSTDWARSSNLWHSSPVLYLWSTLSFEY